MRPIFTLASCAILTVPLLTLGPSARADSNNDFLGQAQKFFNGNDNDRDRDAYQRGREDEWRRQQAQRDRYQRDHEAYRNDRDRDDRYQDPYYRNNNYR